MIEYINKWGNRFSPGKSKQTNEKTLQTIYEDVSCPRMRNVTTHCLICGLHIVNYLQRENLEMEEKENPNMTSAGDEAQ